MKNKRTVTLLKLTKEGGRRPSMPRPVIMKAKKGKGSYCRQSFKKGVI